MKRKGFTLAEVLVTLGIIGVVAALTTPALIQNVGNAKVGPKLAKAKSTFETAAEMMLTENNANTIRSIASNGNDLGKELSKYMKISKSDQDIAYKGYKGDGKNGLGIANWARYDSDDGMIYWFGGISSKSNWPVDTANYEDIPNNEYIALVWVDINGSEGPNRESKDTFRFALYNDGTLRPWGARGFWRSSKEAPDNAKGKYWNENHACDEYAVNNSPTCTGSIFDNGMKIIYQ